MHFQARHLINNYDFQGAQISASDPRRQIDVQIAKRPDDETHPPVEPYVVAKTVLDVRGDDSS